MLTLQSGEREAAVGEPVEGARKGVAKIALGLQRVVEHDYRAVAGIALDIVENFLGRHFAAVVDRANAD